MDIKELEALARAATPGEWEYDGDVWFYDKENETPWLLSESYDPVSKGGMDCSEADAAYIAAANPQTVLKLIEVIRVQQVWLEAIAESEWDASAGLLRNIANAALAKVNELGVE